MNNRIAINMIQSYYAQRKHQITFILGSTLILKVKGVCDGDLMNLGITSTHIITSPLTSLCLFCNSRFELLLLETEPVSNAEGLL